MINENYPVLYLLATYLFFFVGVVFVWFLVSYPFLLVKDAIGEVLYKFIVWTERSQTRLKETSNGLYQSFLTPFRQLIDESRYRYVLEEEEVKINQELKEIKATIEGTTSIIGAFTGLVSNSLESIKKKLEELLGIDNPPEFQEPNIQVPSIRIERSVDEEKRRGFIKFLIFTLVGFFLIVLNTFLLEKFFTIFTSEYIMYSLGIKYSHLIALFYSIAELALGVGFVFSKDNKPFQVMILICISCLAFLEIYIYLYLGLQFAGFEFSDMQRLKGWEVLEGSWMSPFGLAISGVLFIAGHFITEGILEYRRGQDLEVFKLELDSLHTKASNIDQFFSNTNDITQNLSQDFEVLNEASNTKLSELQERTSQSERPLQDLNNRLSVLLQTVNDLRLNPFSEVSETEAKKIVLLHSFFGFMIILISFFFLTFQQESASTIFSLTQIGLLLGASYLLSESLVVVSSEPSNTVVLNPKSTFLKVFCYLTIASIIGFILFSNMSLETTNWLTITASLFCIAGCIWLGRHLKEILAVVVASIKSVFFIILSFVNLTISWVVAILRGVSYIVESVLSLFTFPARKFNQQIFGDKP